MVKVFAKKLKAVLPRLVAGIAVLAGVGYFSSVVTQVKCENAEAQSLINNQLKGKPFFMGASKNL